MRGQLGRLLIGVSAFELGNVAATLLILRATQLLTPGHGRDAAVKIALGLYTAYNLAATLASIPGGRLGDRRSSRLVLLVGVICFGAAYLGFALSGATIWLLAFRSSLRASRAGSLRPPSTPQLLGSHRSIFAVQRLGRLRGSSRSATLPRAQSPDSSGRPSHRGPRSSTSPDGWLRRSQYSRRVAAGTTVPRCSCRPGGRSRWRLGEAEHAGVGRVVSSAGRSGSPVSKPGDAQGEHASLEGLVDLGRDLLDLRWTGINPQICVSMTGAATPTGVDAAPIFMAACAPTRARGENAPQAA